MITINKRPFTGSLENSLNEIGGFTAPDKFSTTFLLPF
jgi:hypothetical protein